MNKRTRKQKTEVRKLASLPDEEIDTSDIPETTDWSKAVVGKFYRPVKQQVTLRLDADIIEFFKKRVHAAGGGNYQTLINDALRQHIQAHDKELEKTLRKIIREEFRRAV